MCSRSRLPMTLEAPGAIARTITPEQAAATAPWDGARMKSPTCLIENGDFILSKPKEFLFVGII